MWQDLSKSPGWALLLEIGQGQYNVRQNQVFRTPCASMDQVLPQEYIKGEAAGIELLMKLPQIMIDNLTAEIENLSQKESENDN